MASSPKRPKLMTVRIRAILSDDLTRDLPLTEVFVATIKDPRTISRIVVDLNSRLPVPDLMHLKRVRGRQIILFPVSDSSQQVAEVLREKKIDTSLFDEAFGVAQVARVGPKVRAQYESVRKLWPCNFHPDPYLEKLTTNTLFDPQQSDEHAAFMNLALEVAKVTSTGHGTVIVDPGVRSVIAFGFDRTDGGHFTQHSVMVAIDNVAKTQDGGVWPSHPLDCEVRERIEGLGFRTDPPDLSDEGPYLCTGYSVYTSREPCITCAMALVHSRARRVFYASAHERGALGSSCKVHVVESLNHHYEAFRCVCGDSQ